MKNSRRELFKLGAVAGLSTLVSPAAEAIPSKSNPAKAANHGQGVEGQRRADLGNGTYINPILAGDNPDPSVLKDGETYYKVSSSFDYYPGLLIWSSQDLVNWQPVCPALTKVVGSVYAPDLVKHDGRYFIYFAATNFGHYPSSVPLVSNYVVHAEAMSGPWSDPVDLAVRNIDPGHAVGDDGKRYLFFAGGQRIQLSDDGLATIGSPKTVFDGWPIPPDWAIETFALEGPKFLKRDGWLYVFWAEGGTAGPPTSHMLVVARSRSIDGPWENCPHNPIVHTQSISEPWWSRGHATPVEGPTGDWWLVYHGYENGFRTLGRQTLLEPMTWTADGWPRAVGGDLSRPLRKPLPGSQSTAGMPLSDDFSQNHLGTRFNIFRPSLDYLPRIEVGGGHLRLSAAGKDPASGTIITWNAGDRSYVATWDLEIDPDATASILLFYSPKAFSGFGTNARSVRLFKNGKAESFAAPQPGVGSRAFVRVVNDEQVASFFISADGKAWRRVVSYEVAGLNHNVFDEFISLRPAIAATGEGAVTVHNFAYRAL